jgi:integrase
MAWTTGKLSDVVLRTAKPAKGLRKLSDGKGLQFWITRQGGRYWRYEYRFHGKRKLLALGTYPEVSASKARGKAAKAREQLADGQDPSEAKRQTKIASRTAHDAVFANVAAKLVAKKRKAGKAEATVAKMEWILRKVDGAIGSRPITAITVQEIVKCLAKEEEAENFETARRMRTVIGEVFRYAMQNGLTDKDPVHATRGMLSTHKPKHFAAILKPERFGELLRAIDGYATRNVVTGSALQLMALLYSRPGELRQAKWDEFDLAKGLWEIPAERMKLRQAHTKALPKQAIAILKELHQVTGPNGNVFPATGRAAHPMSENTMNAALRRMGIPASEHSSHGFRATASTLLNAANMFSSDAIERSLAHQDKDAVRRAYARGDAMAERKKMAQWWADYLDRLRNNYGNGANVIQMSKVQQHPTTR